MEKHSFVGIVTATDQDLRSKLDRDAVGSLRKMFAPQSVAIIGASAKEDKAFQA